jgi:hypothetical protein
MEAKLQGAKLSEPREELPRRAFFVDRHSLSPADVEEEHMLPQTESKFNLRNAASRVPGQTAYKSGKLTCCVEH